MMQRLRKLRQDEGFTLIELLIVIVVLGILAAIVVFSVQGIQGNAQKAACQADVASVTTASEAYYAANGTYAANINALSPTFLHSVPADVAQTGAGGATAPTFAGAAVAPATVAAC